MWLTFFMYPTIFLGKIFSCAFLVQKLINTYNRLILSCPLCLTGIASTTTMSILRLDGERSSPLNFHQFFSTKVDSLEQPVVELHSTRHLASDVRQPLFKTLIQKDYSKYSNQNQTGTAASSSRTWAASEPSS